MTRARIHALGTPIAPAERSDRRRQVQLRLTIAALLGAVIFGAAWGMAAIAEAERENAAEAAND